MGYISPASRSFSHRKNPFFWRTHRYERRPRREQSALFMGPGTLQSYWKVVKSLKSSTILPTSNRSCSIRFGVSLLLVMQPKLSESVDQKRCSSIAAAFAADALSTNRFLFKPADRPCLLRPPMCCSEGYKLAVGAELAILCTSTSQMVIFTSWALY